MKKLWIIFSLIFVCSFAILGWIGTEIFRQAPPLPREVVTTDGTVLIKEGEVSNGQNVWQAMGGMEVGSVWGHGSYVAPDWTADYLHREAVFVLDLWAKQEFQQAYDILDAEHQAQLRGRLEEAFRRNTFDPTTGTLTIGEERALALAANRAHYAEVFIAGDKDYAIPRGAVTDTARVQRLT